MFKIFEADLSLEHPSVVNHFLKISTEYYQNRFINPKTEKESTRIKARLRTIGKICFFLKYPEKIKNPSTVFFVEPGQILGIHPGTGRLVAAYLRKDSHIPILGITFTEYGFDEENYKNNEFISNFKIPIQKTGKSSYIISSEGYYPQDYNLITVPEHVKLRSSFESDKIKHLKKCLRARNLYNVDLFIEDGFLCNVTKDRFKKTSTKININNEQGFYNLCMYLAGLSDSLPNKNIQINTKPW